MGSHINTKCMRMSFAVRGRQTVFPKTVLLINHLINNEFGIRALFPKQVNGNSQVIVPNLRPIAFAKCFYMLCFSIVGVLRLNLKWDFCKFNCCPIILQNMLMILATTWEQPSLVALKKRSASLAKNRCKIWGQPRVGLIPWKSSRSVSSCNIQDTTSIHNRNMNGDKESPWRIPHLERNWFEVFSLMRTLYETVETYWCINLIQWTGNP